ncbi:MAG TPA: hypothetical protein VG406_25225 [Isosphaeraceae bacterium]|nr:hypothetical protein [Isosphaeraceae bacterium]
MRRTLARLARWRPWLVGLHLVTLFLLVGVLVGVVWILQSLAQPARVPLGLLGFLAGFALGAWVGQIAITTVHHLITALIEPRSERLLVKCYDELQAIRTNADQPTRDGPGSPDLAPPRTGPAAAVLDPIERRSGGPGR